MKVRYVGPSPARRLPGGQRAVRGGNPVEVSDELGERLTKNATWEAADEKKKPRPAKKGKE